VVDPDIDWSKLALYRLRDSFHCVGVRDVFRKNPDLRTERFQLAFRLLESFLSPRRDRQTGSARRESICDRAAQPRRTAGNHDNIASPIRGSHSDSYNSERAVMSRILSAALAAIA